MGRRSILYRFVLPTTVLLCSAALFGHTHQARELYARLGGDAQSCPFGGGGKPTGVTRLLAHSTDSAELRGERPSSERFAFGFVLDESERQSVRDWTQAQGASCQELKSEPTLECTLADVGGLSGNAVKGVGGTLFFAFNPQGKLRGIRLMTALPSAAAAAAGARAASADLQARLGAGARHRGEHTASFLDRGLFSQSSTEYRFTDYFAAVRATKLSMALGGFVITQRYESLR